MGVSKNRGKKPKMVGENNGKPYDLLDDLGGNPLFLEPPISFPYVFSLAPKVLLESITRSTWVFISGFRWEWGGMAFR